MQTVSALPASRPADTTATATGAAFGAAPTAAATARRDGTTDSAEESGAAGAASALPNPTLRLDPSLGLVVMEFRDADGTTRSIPSERELEAYRSAGRSLARAETPARPELSGSPAAASAAAEPPTGSQAG